MKKLKVKTTDDKPYIFISYAHADNDEVYPIIEELDRRGYRIWYDKGITGGRKWADEIARHVMDCQIMLLFVSDNYAASGNCEDEWTFAKKHEKNFVCIMLQQTTVSAGMEMQSGKWQHIMRYEVQDDEAFYEELCGAKGMELCLREPEPPAQDEPEQKEETHSKVKAEKNRCRKFSGGGFRKGLAAVLGVLLLVLVIGWAAGGGQAGTPEGTDTVSPQELNKILSGETVSLSDMEVTLDMIQTLNGNKSLKVLEFKNCSFEKGALQQLRSDTLWSFTMHACTGVRDLSCLNQMPMLKKLELTDNTLKDNVILLLNCERLSDVDVSRNPELSNLSWLKASENLDRLECSDTKVSNLFPVASLPQLSYLAAENCPITDITPLKTAQKLVTLDLNGCPVEDPGVTFTCLRLEKLYLSGAMMTSLQPFENCTILKEVDISGSAVADVSILHKSVDSLKKLIFSNSRLDGEDLKFMKNCAHLTEVYADGIPTEDISFLKDAKQLQTLSAAACGLKDISALAQKGRLISLDLSGNQILDISPLGSWNPPEQIIGLDLSGNPLTDAGALPASCHYATLDLRCRDLDLKTLPVLSCRSISVYYSDAIYDSNLADKEKINTYHIYDCPPDRQVKLEDYFSYRLELHTSEAASE